MEDRMDSAHSVREAELIGDRANFSDNVVGTVVLVIEFLRRPCCVDIFGLDVGLLSDLEIRCGSAALVGGSLIGTLGVRYLLAEFLM